MRKVKVTNEKALPPDLPQEAQSNEFEVVERSFVRERNGQPLLLLMPKYVGIRLEFYLGKGKPFDTDPRYGWLVYEEDCEG